MRTLEYLNYTVRYFQEMQTYREKGVNIYEPCLKGIVFLSSDEEMQKPLAGWHFNPTLSEDGRMMFDFKEIDKDMKTNIDKNFKLDNSPSKI